MWRKISARESNEFIRKNNLVSYFQTNMQDWKRFFTYGRNTFGFPKIQTERMPHSDHFMAYKSRNGTVLYVSQPYQSPNGIENELKEWAQRRGLAVEIYNSEYSWYNPGETCLIILHLPGITVEV